MPTPYNPTALPRDAKCDKIQKMVEQCCLPKNGCLLWQDEKTKAGYAYCTLGGKAFAVRRLVIWMAHGYMPRGEYITDTCGKKECCELSHIRDATPEEMRRLTIFPHNGRSGKIGMKTRWKLSSITKEHADKIETGLMLGEITIKGYSRKTGIPRLTIYSALKRLAEDRKESSGS